MRPGGEKRGNSYARRARKDWLLSFFGNGETCRCVHCGCKLTRETVQADRKKPGGSYRRANLQPSCGTCNRIRSNKTDWHGPIVLCLSEAEAAALLKMLSRPSTPRQLKAIRDALRIIEQVAQD